MPQTLWGSCTSLCMNEHSIKVCMNRAATAHRINISSISLTQYLIFIFSLIFISLYGEYQVLYHHVHPVYITGVLFACLCYLCTLGSTPTVWAHTPPALHKWFYPTSPSVLYNCTMSEWENTAGLLPIFIRWRTQTYWWFPAILGWGAINSVPRDIYLFICGYFFSKDSMVYNPFGFQAIFSLAPP